MEAIKGYLHYEPDMHFTQYGKAVTTFTLYELSPYEMGNGYKYKVVTWEELAEHCFKYLVEADYVYAKGYWKARSWRKKDTNELVTVNEFTAHQIIIDNLDGSFTNIKDKQEE